MRDRTQFNNPPFNFTGFTPQEEADLIAAYNDVVNGDLSITVTAPNALPGDPSSQFSGTFSTTQPFVVAEISAGESSVNESSNVRTGSFEIVRDGQSVNIQAFVASPTDVSCVDRNTGSQIPQQVFSFGRLVVSAGSGQNADCIITNAVRELQIFTSDYRLKSNIEMLDATANGHVLYAFDYKPEVGIDGRFVGIMAQDLQGQDRAAIVTRDDGFMAVNYGSLGLRMATWEQWERGSLDAVVIAPR